jgi:hypothetical protein
MGWWLRGVVGGVLLAGMAGVAQAAAVTTTLGVVGGPLRLEWPGATLLRAELDERGDAVAELGTALVIDARGSGAGWRLRIAASALEAIGGGSTDGAELSVTDVRVETRAGRPPSSAISYPLRVPLGESRPVDLFNAAPGTGMGTVALTPRVTLRVPGGSQGGAYQASLTVDVAAGP